MTKITLTDLVNLQNETTAVNAINNNNATLETAFDNTLSRDGTIPNTMGAHLDMNNFDILNLPEPTTNASPVRFQDLQAAVLGTITGPITTTNTTQSTSTTTGSIVAAGGLGIAKNANIGGTLFTGSTTVTGSITASGTITGNMAAATLKGNPSSSSAASQDFTIQGLTARGTPDGANDKVPIYDNAAGSIKYVTPNQLAAGGIAGVSSIAGNGGAFTLGTGLSNSVNQLINTGVVTVKRTNFTSNGTYTPSTGMLYCIVECIGGGGGGGASVGAVNFYVGGSGGGSGGYSRRVCSASDIGASKAVTIGTGGAGGIAGTSNGAAGASTSLGSLCIANGGSGAINSSFTNGGTFGAGATAGTGDITAPGSDGGAGVYMAVGSTGVTSVISGGFGAAGFFGAQTQSTPQAASAGGGTTGKLYGGGGSGAASASVGFNANGGAGSAGICIVTEFCSQ